MRNKYKTGMSFADLLLLLCTFPAPNPQMSMIAVRPVEDEDRNIDSYK